jgi:hypothetical protein
MATDGGNLLFRTPSFGQSRAARFAQAMCAEALWQASFIAPFSE